MYTYTDSINSSTAENLYGFSQLDFLNFKNQQKQTAVSSLVSGIPRLNAGIFDSVSPTLMYEIYDAKAVTPNIVRNYLDRVDQTLTPESNQVPEPERDDYQTIVDEVIAAANPEPEPEEADEPTGDAEDTPAAENSEPEHFGIVGEIMDKYA